MLAREGALALSTRARCRPPPGARFASPGSIERPGADKGAARLSAALTRLGPSYVKFGQFLATRPDIVGMAAARDLEHLQDRMAPFPQPQAERVVADTARPAARRSSSPPSARPSPRPPSRRSTRRGSPTARPWR